MAEFEVPVTTVRVHFRCDGCGQEPKYYGLALASNPPRYVHECPCGLTHRLLHVYPTIRYVEVEKPAPRISPPVVDRARLIVDGPVIDGAVESTIVGSPSITSTCLEAHRIAIELGVAVRFEFNGVIVTVSQRDDPMEVVDRWQKEMHRRGARDC